MSSPADQLFEDFPDHRKSYPDPQLSRDEDARIAHELAELAPALDFRALLDEHWRLIGRPPELGARFTAHELGARARSEPIVDAVENARRRPFGTDDRLLEIGCGTAAFAAAVARRGATAVATDASLRWLVLAQKRLADEETTGVDLAACAAEDMPFPDASFDVVAAADVIEHVEDPSRFVAECARVLRPGGLLFLATPNRYSLGLEPHVRLWGVGFLPRPLAERYVQSLRKTSYSHVRLLSARELRALLERNGFEPRIELPQVPESALVLSHGPELAAARAYNRMRAWPAAQPALLAAGPFFHVFARKGAPGRR